MKKIDGVIITATLSMWLVLDGGTCAAATIGCQPRVRSLNRASVSKTVVTIYWDRSGSMRHFGDVVRGIVETLDSAVLPQAGASSVVHMSVGSTIQQMRDALPALNADQGWTALHTAAERSASDLASGKSGVAIYVSDMILEIPAKERKSKPFACAGVAMPSNEHAGAIFGRCFSAGLSGSMLPDLYASAFRITVKGRRLYIFLIGTNVALARDIDLSMKATWDDLKADHFTIADTAAAVSVGGVSCSWSPAAFRGLRLANAAVGGECRFRCEDEAQTSLMNCHVRPPASGTWITAGLPTGTTLSSALAFSRTTAVRVDGFSVQLQCPKRRKYVTSGTTLTYPWKTSMPISVSPDAEVRRLFDSVLKALAAAVPQRSIEVTFDVQ